MGALGFAKTIFIPAIISLTLYLLIFFLILPFFRRYHQRYSSYLPLDSISIQTTSLRDRIADVVMRFVLRSSSSWRRRRDGMFDHDDDEDDTGSIDVEQGEMMVGMDMRAARREVLEEQRRGLGTMGTTAGPFVNSNSHSNASVDARTRLSRDLEEGFMDDTTSDEEDDDARVRRGRV